MTPMQVIHRVTISTTPQIRKELAALGLAVGEGFVTFEVDESNPAWSEISTWISRSGAVDVVSTKFTTTEMNAASWFALAPTWHCGYPQPEDEYLEVTYDLSAYCPSCGIGAVQRAPFRMKGEPRWFRQWSLCVSGRTCDTGSGPGAEGCTRRHVQAFRELRGSLTFTRANQTGHQRAAGGQRGVWLSSLITRRAPPFGAASA